MGRIIKLLSIFIIFLISILYFLSSGMVYADTSCEPIYGGGPTCVTTGGLVLNATVMNPQTNKMVDNLKPTDPTYKPGSLVTLQLMLTNVTTSTFREIDVQNVFPMYVNYLAGEGNFDQNSRILSFKVKDLEPNKPKTYTLMGKIVEAQQLPDENSINCVVNQATGIVLDPASAGDTSTFCIEKKIQVTPTPINKPAEKSGFPILTPPPTISKTPATGPESLALFSLVPTGILGWYLRKKSRRLRL